MAIDSMRKPRMMFGIFALSLASTSCLRQKTQARVFTPPPPRARPSIPPQNPLPDAPPVATAQQLPPIVEPTPDTTGEIPEAPRRATRRPVVPVAPKPPITVVPEPVAPRLGQMFTPEELRENTKELDDTLNRVNRALAVVEGKNLTAEQKEIAERIRTFRKQAEQAREQDLLTAVSLARRADLLAKDLLERLP